MNILSEILVIDTDSDFFTDVFKNCGYNFRHTSSFDSLLSPHNADNNYNLLLLNVIYPKINGWDLFESIRSQFINIPIILTGNKVYEPDMVLGLRLGADDYIVKPFNLDILSAKLQAVLRRSSVLIPDINLKNNLDFNLTNREIEIISFIAKGYSNKQIAEELFLSELTVKSHLKNIFKKINVQNRTQASMFALNNGFIKNEI